ncbi:unnamed protein product [Clonostachys rosea]|uniref:GPI inositol-deacylase winged helix domain-containing protein n=1 Tax=Bionectria ochroleuca TaxID=29856 RepID=A0ABY6UIU0_BIOOC|nr:unnamed protein product [Clonostachys rosea]
MSLMLSQDECPENTRYRFLSAAETLTPHLKLFLTSRHNVDVDAELSNTRRFDFFAEKSDIELFLQDRIEHIDFRKLQSTLRKEPSLKDHIIQTLTAQSNGMFLLAHLQLEQLQSTYLARQVKMCLNVIATDINEFYGNSLRRIDEEKGADRVLALRVLSYIFCARRPLSMDELVHAISTNPDMDDLANADLHEKFVILSNASGLIRLDEKTGSVRLTHLTLHEHLQKCPQRLLPDYEREFAASCLRYMSFEPFSVGPCSTATSMDGRLRLYCFLEYACHYWAHHARNCMNDEEILELLFPLLTDYGKRESSVQVVHLLRHRVGDWHDRYPRNFTALHAAAFWGLTQSIEHLASYSEGIDSPGTFQQTALLLAAKNGHDSTDHRASTPLSWAARNGHEEIVGRLLKNGSQPTTEDEEGWTPLHWAIMGGHIDIVKLLLDISSTIEPIKSQQNKALILAAEAGVCPIIELLLAEGADVDYVDKAGSTPLHWAVPEGHKTATKILSSRGANPNSRDEYLNVPLHWSIISCDITNLLLSYKANPNAKNQMGQTPLLWAALLGRSDVVKVLIEGGADVNIKDSYAVTALHAAAATGDEPGARFLINSGANVDALDWDAWTPLHAAAVKGHESLVSLLLQHTSGADAIVQQVSRWLSNSDHRYLLEAMSSRKSSGSTVVSGLRSAVNSGYGQRLLQLLENGADIDALDEVGGFPAITHAAWMGRDHLVEILLDNGAKVDNTDRNGYTSLHIAAENGYWQLVEMLVTKGGASVDEKVFGLTALLLAAKIWERRIVRFLLESGADAGARPDEPDHCGQTPLHWAVAGRSALAVRFLLAQKVRSGLQARDGYKSLHLAAYTGQLDIIELLIKAQGRLVRRKTLLNMTENIEIGEVVDIMAKEKDGFTALDMAILTGNINVAQRLREEYQQRGPVSGFGESDYAQEEVIPERTLIIPPSLLFPKNTESDFTSHNNFQDGLGVALMTDEARQWLLERRKIRFAGPTKEVPVQALPIRKAPTNL